MGHQWFWKGKYSNGKNKIVTVARSLRKEEMPQWLAHVRMNVETEDIDETVREVATWPGKCFNCTPKKTCFRLACGTINLIFTGDELANSCDQGLKKKANDFHPKLDETKIELLKGIWIIYMMLPNACFKTKVLGFEPTNSRKREIAIAMEFTRMLLKCLKFSQQSYT